MGFSLEEFPNSDYYNSDLRKILKYMREFKNTLDGYEDIIETLSLAIKDIDSMKDAILALQVATADLDTIRTNIETLFTDFSALSRKIDDIDVHFESLSERIDLLKQYVDSNDHLLDIKIEYNRILLENEINELRKAILDIDTETFNPWHYELGKVTLGHNFRLAYDDLADSVPTAEEYAGLGLTANDYSAFDLTAIRYCLRGKKELKMYWVYSPCFGWRQEISNVLTSIIDYFRDTLTANQYTAKNLTADGYTALDMSAEEYFSYSRPTYVTNTEVSDMIDTAMQGTVFVDEENTGINAAQYDLLGIKPSM